MAVMVVMLKVAESRTVTVAVTEAVTEWEDSCSEGERVVEL